MRIALILDPRLPPDRLAALGTLAERHGIEGVWTSSLLGCRDPFVSFVPLAQATQALRMGPIAVNPFDIHPTRIAASLLTLNELSAGRARIVLGGGGEALASLGIRPARRVRAVREAAAILRRAAAGEVFDFEGQIYRVTRFDTRWATAAPPAIWIGANGPQMLAMAGVAADGIMLSDLPQPLLGQAIASANAARRAGAPDAAPLLFSNFVAWHVYADRAAARAEARRWLAYRGISRRWVCTTFMSDGDFDLIEAHLPELYGHAQGGPEATAVPSSLLDLLVDRLTITGTTDDLDPILAHLCELRDAGLSQVALRLYQEPERSIELIGRSVVPAVA